MQSTGKCLKSNKVFTTQCLALNKVKRQDIRFTKQISVTRISNLPSILEKRDFDWGGGAKWLSGGATMGAGGGGFGPPSYIVKKCPESIALSLSSLVKNPQGFFPKSPDFFF